MEDDHHQKREEKVTVNPQCMFVACVVLGHGRQ